MCVWDRIPIGRLRRKHVGWTGFPRAAHGARSAIGLQCVRTRRTARNVRTGRPCGARSPDHPGPAACGPTHLSGRDAEKAGESPRPRRLCLPGGSDEVEQGPGRRFPLLEKAHVTGMLEPYGTCPGMTRCELSGCRCADVAVVQVRQACAACFPGLSQKNDCPRGLGQSRKKVTEKSCARKNRLNLNMSQRYEKFPPPPLAPPDEIKALIYL